ncbi:hypothetical protein V6Z11_A11G320400 [Gossypium hirsutum]
MSIKKENMQHILIHMKARKGLKFGGDRRAMMFFPGRIQQGDYIKVGTFSLWLEIKIESKSSFQNPIRFSYMNS